MHRLTVKERIFYDVVCSENRVYRHWYTRFLLAGVDLERIRRVVGRIRRWRDWCSEWSAEGCRLEAMAEQAQAAGDVACARRLFHEAAGCFQVGQHFFYLDDGLKARALERIWSLYPRAVALDDGPGRPVRADIPFGGLRIPAYCRFRPESGRPLVVQVNGLDNLKEIEQHAVGRLLFDAGLNTIAFDGPGQGEMRRSATLPADYHTAVTAVVDWFEREHGDHVDLDRIAVVGFSLGGYLAPVAAAHDHRISCAVGNGAPAHLRFLLPARRANPILFRGIPHAAGTDTLAAAVGRLGYDIATVPPLDRPLLVFHSGRDRIIPHGRAHAQAFMDWAVGEKELRFYPDGEHVCANYLDEVLPRTVDWVRRHLRS